MAKGLRELTTIVNWKGQKSDKARQSQRTFNIGGERGHWGAPRRTQIKEKGMRQEDFTNGKGGEGITKRWQEKRNAFVGGQTAHQNV